MSPPKTKEVQTGVGVGVGETNSQKTEVFLVEITDLVLGKNNELITIKLKKNKNKPRAKTKSDFFIVVLPKLFYYIIVLVKKIYNFAGLGGTFDHFHQGHKEFLQFAANLSQNLIIGCTDKKMSLGKPWPQSIQDLSQRLKAVKKFTKTLGVNCEFIILKDLYGSTLEDERLEALIATTETRRGCETINQARKQLRLKTLPIMVCQMFKDQSGKELHADRIRAGLVNRDGLVYSKIFNQTIKLNLKQRQFFTKPQGKIVEKPRVENSWPVILVGDGTVDKFIQNHWPYQLGIFDYQIERQEAFGHSRKLQVNQEINNPAGFITTDLSQAILKTLSQLDKTRQLHLLVRGEEDLATVATVLHAPFGAYVYYGQPKQGLVEISIDENVKEKFAKALA